MEKQRVHLPEQHPFFLLFAEYVDFGLFENMGHLKVPVPPEKLPQGENFLEPCVKGEASIGITLKNLLFLTRTAAYPTVGNVIHLCLMKIWLSSCGKAQVFFFFNLYNFYFFKEF